MFCWLLLTLMMNLCEFVCLIMCFTMYFTDWIVPFILLPIVNDYNWRVRAHLARGGNPGGFRIPWLAVSMSIFVMVPKSSTLRKGYQTCPKLEKGEPQIDGMGLWALMMKCLTCNSPVAWSMICAGFEIWSVWIWNGWYEALWTTCSFTVWSV